MGNTMGRTKKLTILHAKEASSQDSPMVSVRNSTCTQRQEKNAKRSSQK